MTFESHLASEKEEENGEVRVESCFVNKFNDDEDVELVTIPGKSIESDRGENADGGVGSNFIYSKVSRMISI